MDINSLAPWIAIVVTLILSILIPLFTQIANNRFQLKLKRMEYKDKKIERRLVAYENDFKNVGGCVLCAQKENISNAGASIQRLYTYFPEDKWKLLDVLFDNIKKFEWDHAKVQMKEVSKIIAYDINKIEE